MKRVVVFVVLAAVLFSSCATQQGAFGNAHQTHQSAANILHWIVGTWKQENGTVWVFNIDGTGTAGKENFTYGISGEGEIYLSNGWGSRKLFLSPDGRRMIIMGQVFQKE